MGGYWVQQEIQDMNSFYQRQTTFDAHCTGKRKNYLPIYVKPKKTHYVLQKLLKLYLVG